MDPGTGSLRNQCGLGVGCASGYRWGWAAARGGMISLQSSAMIGWSNRHRSGGGLERGNLRQPEWHAAAVPVISLCSISFRLSATSLEKGPPAGQRKSSLQHRHMHRHRPAQRDIAADGAVPFTGLGSTGSAAAPASSHRYLCTDTLHCCSLVCACISPLVRGLVKACRAPATLLKWRFATACCTTPLTGCVWAAQSASSLLPVLSAVFFVAI